MRSLKFGSAPLWAPRQNLGPCHVAGLAVPDLFTPATLVPTRAKKDTFNPPCGMVRERGGQIRHSRHATALKTRLPSIYSGASPLGSPAHRVRSRGSSPSGAGPNFWLSGPSP
jgi:hypothetical protein